MRGLRLAVASATLAATFVAAGSRPALAAEGDLDPTFGGGGVVTTPLGGLDDVIYAIARDAQGRIVAVGASYSGGYRFVLARYTTSGNLDPTFGTGGKVIVSSSSALFANSIAIDAQGRIVLAGQLNSHVAVFRFGPTGAPDNTFGTGGTVTTSIGDQDGGNAVTIDHQGRIVVAGRTVTGGNADALVLRYKTDGSPDTTFHGTGIVTTPIGVNHRGSLAGVAVDAQDRVVGAGTASNTSMQFAVVRYTAAGALDGTFGSGGVTLTPIGDYGGARAMTLDAQGRIVAAGVAHIGSVYEMAMARYGQNGALDASFGSGGTASTLIGTTSSEAHAVAIDPQGRVVLAGAATVNGGFQDIALARFKTNGTLDPAFGSQGKILTLIGPRQSIANAVSIDPASRITVGGYADASASMAPADHDFALARYTGDQVPPAVQIGSGPAEGGFTNDATPTFGFTVDDPAAHATCSVDGLGAACSSPFTPAAALAGGSHTFSVTATDLAGNKSAAATRSFIVDTKPPAVVISGKRKLKARAKRTKARFRIVTNEPATLVCKLDKRAAKACKARYTTVGLRPGKHRLRVTATDRAGNVAVRSVKFRIVPKPKPKRKR